MEEIFVGNSWIHHRFQSVRSRLILLVAIITCAALGLGSLLVRQAEQNERAAIAQQLSATARALASAVDLQLGQIELLHRALSASAYLKTHDFDGFDKAARTVADGQKVWIRLADRNGRQLINTRLLRGQALPTYPMEPEMKATLERGEIYVSDMSLSKVTGTPVLFVAGMAGEAEYVLTVAMDPAVFAEGLAVRRLAPEGTVAIVDRKGILAARNRNPERFVGKPASAKMIKIFAEKMEGVMPSVTLDQIPVLTAFHRAQCGWTVVVALPQEGIYASVRRLSRLAWISSGALLGLTLFVAIWIGRGLVKGVQTLVADSEQIALGSIPANTPTGLAETDLVANALRRTAAELKNREKELKQAKDKLEQKVQERTASLLETTQQLETFCYSVAHDLRSPLRAQQGFAEALIEEYHGVLDETGRDYLFRISRSARRLDTLVNDLLTYTRINRSELKFAPVDLNQTLSEVRIHLAEQIALSKARLTAEPLPLVLAHEPTLGLVLTNLVSNALKFVAAGVEPNVCIRGEERGNLVRLWVEDNGIGISAEYTSRIFGVFERLHPAKVYPGTGIGLAIVKKAIERMGGQVGVESEPGKGSRFWIELPKG